MSFIFQTERLTVRQYSMSDLRNFAELNGSSDVMRYIRTPKTYEESKVFLSDIIRMYDILSSPGRLAVETKDSKQFIGSFAVIPIIGTQLTQIGYALLKPYWGYGFASELVKGSMPFLREMKIDPVYGITYPENIASQQVLIKNGFVFDQKFMDDDVELFRYVYQFIES